MLRLEADRFGAAEYAEVDRYGAGRRFGVGSAWYIVGLGLVVATWFDASRIRRRSSTSTLGDRSAAVVGGLIYGGIGVAQAAAFALLRYRHLRLPAVASYPVALLNSVGTAFIDEAAFRGAVLGFLILIGVEPGKAIILQALLYGLATRLGAPGRDRYMLVLSLVIGLGSGYVTLRTGGIGAAFLGHAITRFATFVATGHAGQPAPVGREVEEIEKRRRIPDGWATVGTSRESIDRQALSRGPCRAPAGGWTVPVGGASSGRDRLDRGRPSAAGRAVRPRPVLRLDLPVLRLRGRGRLGDARPAEPDRRLRRGAPRRARPPGRRARRAVRASRVGRPGGGRHSARSTSAAARRRSWRPSSWRRSSTGSAAGSAWPTGPRSPSRRTPAPTSGATPTPSRRSG